MISNYNVLLVTIGGHDVAFIHPKAATGVLVELVQVEYFIVKLLNLLFNTTFNFT